MDSAVVEVVVEVPRGSRNKYEIDRDGLLRFERRLPRALSFPADYGFVPGTRGSDGEPLDAVVLMVEPTLPGVRVQARVIGVLWIRTGHGREAKLLTVPADDPAYRDVGDLADLPPHQVAELAQFFEVYRDLDPGTDVSFDGSDGRGAAMRLLAGARES